MISTKSLPALGTNDVIIASTAKVPEPCTGTVTCVPWPPANSTISFWVQRTASWTGDPVNGGLGAMLDVTT